MLKDNKTKVNYMHLIFNKQKLPVKDAEETLEETLNLSIKVGNFLTRVSIYSLVFTVFLWFYLAFPETIFDGEILEFISLLLLLIFLPVIHELIHLLARPWQIFRDDTYFLMDFSQPISRFYMAIIPGGKITREGFIWLSLLPFLVLTVLPFVMIVTSTWPFPVLFGVLACLNFTLSTYDIYQSYVAWKEYSYGEVLSDGLINSSQD